jgi:catechol 2,3-dioxygenase-like lactoylglutathione lyase family enzyme
MEGAMQDPTYVLLYVEKIPASEAFYADLLGKKPVESSPTFSMFVLDNGVKLGLWRRDTVEPLSRVLGGGAELAIQLADADADAVRATHEDWRRRDLTIAQTPTTMDFGYTFVTVDPDGHRLRVFAPVTP